MLKRNLLKRVLPMLLSIAMVFESMPATALAAEYEQAESVEKAEEPDSEQSEADNKDAEADNAETENESVQERDSVSQTAEAVSTEKETGDTETEYNKSDTEKTEIETKADQEIKEEAEVLAEGETSSQTEVKEPFVAKIVVDDKKADNYAKENNGFTRKLNEKTLVFFTDYAEESKCGAFQQAVENWLTVEVDGETIDGLKDRLTYSWIKKAAAEGEADTPLPNDIPREAGTYELTVSLDMTNLNGLCEKLESDVKISLTIEKADIGFHFDKTVTPGITAGEFIDELNKTYTIRYKDGKDDSYKVSRDILGQDDPDKKLPLNLFVIDESGTRQQMNTEDMFDRNKDYILTIGDVVLTENAARNYELSVEEFYIIEVGERQKTSVIFERKDPGKDLIETYASGKTWTIDEVTGLLFTDAVTDAQGNVIKKSGAPTVYVAGKEEDDEEVILEGAVVEAKWYTRIHLDNGETYETDEDAGEIRYQDENGKDDEFVYQPMDADPEDAGEYFIIWSYAGDDSAYEKSHSDALRFTIDPAPIAIKINKESVDAAGFSDGMTYDDIKKALAAVSYGVFPVVLNETTGVMELDTTEQSVALDFFGTSYRGDVDADQTVQYYVPEFVLERRVVKITEKGEAAAAVDPRAVDWKEVTDMLWVTIDEEQGFDSIGKDELPINANKENLEAVEFEYRVVFTGNKVVYDNDGNKDRRIPITDVTTNAANRNYLTDITKKMLEDTAIPVTIKEAQSVQIAVEGIVDAFINDNKDMLAPQIPEDAADSARAVHQGTFEHPAVKIYDKNALFADRASYKKAEVRVLNESGEPGEALSILPTDKSLEYTWNYTTLEKYEEFLEKWDEVQIQYKYKDFEEYYHWNENELGWTDPADGSFGSVNEANLYHFNEVGLYRLMITYKDPNHEYQSAKAEVFFKVERQEVIIVPHEQYIRNGDSIASLTGRTTGVNKEDFVIYRLPHNSIDEYDKLTDEEKKGYELPTDEEVTEYETTYGKKPELTLNNLVWEVRRQEKDPTTGVEKEPAKWIEVNEGSFDDDFIYGTVVHWNGSIDWFDDDNYYDIDYYTTLDVKTHKTTGEEKHHEAIGAVKFYDQQIYVEVDAERIQALGHEYDGNPANLTEAAKALTFYTDEALTESSKLSTDAVLNTTDEYDPAKINIYWVKEDKAGNKHTYANKNAVYGGTYKLALRFEGGQLGTTASPDTPVDAQDDAAAPTYAPLCLNGIINRTGWITKGDDAFVAVNADENEDCAFTISPRKITITPMAAAADSIIAGEKADSLLTNELTVEGILEKDQPFFLYTEIAAGGFDLRWDGSNEDGTDKEKPAYIYRIDKNGGYPAFYDNDNNRAEADAIIQIDDRVIKNPEAEYLRFNGRYTVKLQNELASPLKESYQVVYGTAEAVVEQRGEAEITNNVYSADDILYNVDNNTYVIKPRGAVKFYDTVQNGIGKDGNETFINTNIFGFRIWAPKEFLNADEREANKEKFIYQNAIWNAGGYFLDSKEWRYNNERDNYYIDVIFPVTKEDAVRSFNITWEDNYTETFTLADMVLEDDLTKAVAPKSIAFNGVEGKMAVGETQQLDLKLTKAQLGDVISIRYRIKGGGTKNEFISLDSETGIVTALKAGKGAGAVIEAYPVYRDADGNIVPVKDSKGKEAKAASTKITVMEVTASAVKKVVPQDESAALYFTVAQDGYRREIYVVDVTKGTEYQERKKWKPADFNKAIDEMKNGDWKSAGFAIRPIYSYADNTELEAKAAAHVYDTKMKAHIETLYELEAEREYVVYVRNVSAARALDDGSVVALSANGAVKSFKTTKSQMNGLELDFTIKTGETDKKNTVTHPVNEDGSIDTDAYTVELSAKKAQVNVYGLFSDRAGGNAAAEYWDERRYSLIPTLKEEKDALKKYQLPKLEFVVLDEESDAAFHPDLKPSKYATISNKGLITLKGVDLNGEKTVYIYARNSLRHENDDGFDNTIALTITAKPASVTGKKVKMKVGQEIKLSDYLEYKDAGKKKLPYYRSCGVTITNEMIASAKANGYEITDVGNNMEHDWRITAIAPNKAKFDLAVTDYDSEGNPMQAVVTLTSTQIDPVKGLKVTYVDDQNITINFTHPANLDEWDTGSVYEYALEVKDARGSVVDKIILSNPNRIFDIDGLNAKELKNAQSWIQYANGVVVNNDVKRIVVLGEGGARCFNYYTGTKTKTKTFAYTYHNPKLVRLSAYTLSVTPLYGNQKADKAAVAKTKTTNIPANYGNVDLTGAGTDRLGGNGNITLTTINKQNDRNGNVVNNGNATYRFISGNTYTLRYEGVDTTRDRVSDTLTWKSSNTKVAAVKANTGTYSATLKAVSKGRTMITVTSKVTKKVIARWQIVVYAVKDGSSYGGDYEPTWANGFYEKILALYDPFYEGRLEVLSVDVPFVIANEDDTVQNAPTWVSFTAPHYGEYTFSFTRNGGAAGNLSAFYDSKDGAEIEKVGNGNTLHLAANQKVYFRVQGNGTLRVSGEEFARLTKNHTKQAPLEVKKGYVSFTAWEDNVYIFWYNGTKQAVDGKTETGMKAGETKFIRVADSGKMYVTYHEELTEEELKLGSHPTGSVTIDKDKQVQYISFTANTENEYKFSYKAVEGVAVTFMEPDGTLLTNKNLTAADASGEETVKSFWLEEGKKIVIEFKAEPEITDAMKTFSVAVTVAEAQQKRQITDSTITIPKGTTEIVKYVVPAFATETAKFRFKADGEEGTEIINFYNEDYESIKDLFQFVKSSNEWILILSKTSKKIKAGDIIYIQVKAEKGVEGTDSPESSGGTQAAPKTKDTVLTVTQVPVEGITADSEKTKEITNDTEQWYTFTAPKDGYYEFGVTVAERAESDNTPTHDAKLAIYNELFGTLLKTNIRTEILAMKTGEMLAIKLNPGYVKDIVKEGAVKEDGTKEESTIEVVKSTAAVSVKTLDVQPLALGEEKAVKVEIPAKSKEVRYYSFTAAVKADYTISWQAADTKTDNAKVTYFSQITSQSGAQTVAANGSSIALEAGGVRYIRVEIDDAESANAVNGTLCVTAANLNADPLTEGTAYPFRLEDKDNTDNESVQKVVRFTALEAGNYAIVTTVDNHPISELPYAYPTITTGGINVKVPHGIVAFDKGETKYFVLSFKAEENKEVKETAGTILIRSLAEPFTGDQMDVSVANDNVKEYTYTIPESGRYAFKAAYDEEKANVEWRIWRNEGWIQIQDGDYYRKNTRITVVVQGTDEEADAVVKLSKPTLIGTTALTVGDANNMEAAAGETKFYELNVAAPTVYSFTISDIPVGKADVSMRYALNESNEWKTLLDGSSISMAKDSRLVVKVTSASKEKDASCKLSVTANTQLQLSDNAVHLEAGASVKLTYRAYETGWYSFNVNQPGAQLVLTTNGTTKVGDNFYDIVNLTAKRSRTYQLTNEGSSAVDLTVTMKKVEPIELQLGNKTEEVTIAAGQWAHFALKTFKNAEYIIRINDTGKGAYLKAYLGTVDDKNPEELKKLADGAYIEKQLHGETMLYIQNDGIEETKAVIELAVSEEQPLTEEPITLAKNESKKIRFIATADGRYLISNDNENVTMTLVSRNEEKPGTTVQGYSEALLKKGDKLVYKLSYEPDEKDEKAETSQTVNVKIAPIQPGMIETEITSVMVSQKDNRSLWYQFQAPEDAVYTFTLEDTYGNEMQNCFTFFKYMNQQNGDMTTEQYIKAGGKLFVNVNTKGLQEGAYTLKYTASKAITQTGIEVMDFEYLGEVQKVKFVVPRGGVYKISAAAVRGSFTVSGAIGETNSKRVFDEFPTSGGVETKLLKKDDIVTITVKAASSGKSSVSLRINEVSMADTLTLGTEVAAMTETQDRYYEIRVQDKGFYAITAITGGDSDDPVATYTCTGVVPEMNEKVLNGTDYVELNANERIIIKVTGTDKEKEYRIKVAKVEIVSLDGKNTEKEPFTLSAESAHYGFTTDKAYIQYKVPADGSYYIAVELIDESVADYQVTDTAPAQTPEPAPTPAAKAIAEGTFIHLLEKDHILTFTFEKNPNSERKEALFKLTIREVKAADKNPIEVNKPVIGTLDWGETINYQFKSAEDGNYLISFKGSNCMLDGYKDGQEMNLKKDDVRTIKVKNTSNETGIYTLAVTKMAPTVLTLGTTAEGTLKKGETVYYEFTAAEKSDNGTRYQVYLSDTYNIANWTIEKVNAAVEAQAENYYYNKEYVLNEKDKLTFKVTNNGSRTTGCKLTVKKISYTTAKIGETVSGTLEAHEKTYYEFTSEEDTQYRISIDSKDKDVIVDSLQKAVPDADGKLGAPTQLPMEEDKDGMISVSLKKGEKLYVDLYNNASKADTFELKVEKTVAEEMTFNPISDGETKKGSLVGDEKAGYEFTAAEGTLYSVYFEGKGCSFVRTTTETKEVIGDDGKPTTKTETVTKTGALNFGSNEFTWKKDDKIRFTVSGAGKYELNVKKAEYTALTQGTTVAKTLRSGETAYYQFTSQDDPASGETTIKYQVYGSFNGYTVQTRIVTVGEDGKANETGWNNKSSEYDLKKGQILQFKVTNSSSEDSFKLAVKKVQYSTMTLGTAVEGRLDIAESGYAYYEFTSQDDPAEGQTQTMYQVYGTAYYYYSKVTVNEDNTLTSSGWNYRNAAEKISLAKGERLRFRVTNSSKPEEGYNLTVAKTEEKPVTVNSKAETGRLGRGQELVYVLKYENDTPAAYMLSYEQTKNVVVVSAVNDSTVGDEQRIKLSKGETLRITITASDETDNFAFTLSEFKPETMTLGTMTGLKKLALNETAYYQYTAGEDGSYAVSMVESESGRLMLEYEVSRANAVISNHNTISGGVGELALQKDDVVLFKVTAPGTKAIAAFSFKLMLQKKTTADAMTALPWNGTLKQGEVKYLKFTIPEEKKTNGTKYTVSIPYTSGSLKFTYNDSPITIGQPYYNRDTSDDFVLRVANISMYNEAECSIDVQENPYVDLGAGSKEAAIAKGKTEYYKYTPPVEGVYALSYSGKVKVQYSTDQTATKTWKNVSAAGICKINVTGSARTIYLTISHNSAEETEEYKVSIEEIPYEAPENFRLRASATTACIGSDKLYLYLDTDIEADQITVFYGKKGSNTKQQIDLYDDGNTQHGDDMKGDGTYSALLYPAGSEDMEMQFTAEYGQEKSNTVAVKYYMPLPEDVFGTMDDVDNEIDDLLSASDFTEKTDEEKLGMVTDLLNELVEDDKILDDSIYIDEENSLVSFQYPGEILGGVMYGEFEGDFNGELSGKDTADEKTSYPERNTYIPASAYDNAIDTQQSQDIGKALILNSFPDFETDADMVSYRTKFYETLKAEWDETGIKTLLDTNVTVDDYKNLQNYNVVCISTHGSVYTSWFDGLLGDSGDPAICLSQPTSRENNKKYKAELKNKQIAKVNGSYWILPSFFTEQYGESALDNTFVFSECCMAMGTGKGADASKYDYTMAKAFTGRGAKAYIGFHNSVFADYSREFMEEYVNNLIEGKTSGEAYDAAVDKYGANHEAWYNATHSDTLAEAYKDTYDPLVSIAYPVHNGDRNAVLINDGLQNGGFEQFKSVTTAPKVWACMGDVRTLTQLGAVAPYGGDSKRMAILTTGIGAKQSAVFEGGTEGSMLSQTFRIPDGVETLYFDYDFISEEPMEFVGSIFDDNFGIQISKSGNTVLKETYESINTSDWEIIEGINFAGGDDTAFHTGWKTAAVDVSAYSGEVITLSFIIYDVGDRIYDSACVVDNVMLE